MFFVILAVITLMVMAEVYVFALVAGAIGVLNAIGLLILLSVFGVWLTKREGIGLLARTRRQLDAGQMPANQLIDATLLLAAGLLLVIPGFVTDFFGLLLLLPPVRALVRSRAKKHWAFRIVTYGNRPPVDPGYGRPDPGYGRPGPDDVIDI
jgi:UPF0716 protein FxsA